MKTLFKAMCLIWGLFGSSAPLLADELLGDVYVSGSDLHTETHVDIEKDRQGPRLCPGEMDNRIRRLSELQVRVVGTWQLLGGGVKDCFAPSSFQVVRMVSGRDAAVGQLSADSDGAFLLTSSDGSVLHLADLPPHLRQLLGEMVILDLKPMGNAAVKGVNKVVVSSRHYP